MRNNFIALILVHIGPLPSYFKLFLISCKLANSVDVIVFSDQTKPDLCPRNMTWNKYSALEISKIISSAVGVKVEIGNGYKLCDLRPTFGLVFEDYIKEYEYWGCTDSDVLLGDFKSALKEELALCPDVISGRGEFWLSGPLTLYRNNDYIRRLFLHAPDYKTTLSSPRHMSFDESCGRWDGPHTISEVVARGLPVSMSDIVNELSSRNEIRYANCYRLREYKSGFFARDRSFRITCSDGKLLDQSDSQEIALYHLLFNKTDPFFTMPRWSSFPEKFEITNFGIFEISTVPHSMLIKHLRRVANGALPFAKKETERLSNGIARRLRAKG